MLFSRTRLLWPAIQTPPQAAVADPLRTDVIPSTSVPNEFAGNEYAGAAVGRGGEVLSRILGAGDPHAVLTESLNQPRPPHRHPALIVGEDATFLGGQSGPAARGDRVGLAGDREAVEPQCTPDAPNEKHGAPVTSQVTSPVRSVSSTIM